LANLAICIFSPTLKVANIKWPNASHGENPRNSKLKGSIYHRTSAASVAVAFVGKANYKGRTEQG
jgi:hypothetical protein